MKERIEEKNCKECLHFEACCKWTDFPKQLGFPVCRSYRKQISGEWIFHKDGSATCNQCNTTQKHICDMDNYQSYCGHCGAHMKGGAE